MNKTIELSGLKIGYSGKLKNKQIGPIIDFDAAEGDLIALIGSNGIGKSTLLRTIVHLLSPLSGEIKIKSKPFNEIREDEYATLLSFVSTEPVRVSNLTVYQLVALGRFPYTNWIGKFNDTDKKIVEEAIELVNLENLKSLFINEISDGERQRAMIARALAQDTPIIILDEPTAYLDLINKYDIVHLLENLCHAKRKSIIFSTHDLNIALSHADKIWLMNKDQVKQGAPEDLVFDNTFSDFSGNKLEFNWQTGIFKQIRNSYKSVSFICEAGLLKELMTKALNRIGYSIIPNASVTIEITGSEKETEYIIKEKTETTRLKNIYDVCRYLKDL
jgi:iron complex transport system ATP-binding protein